MVGTPHAPQLRPRQRLGKDLADHPLVGEVRGEALIAAVELYEHYLTLMPALTLSRWPAIPIRDGALSIYHFGMSMAGIRNKLGLCPTLHGLVDTDKFREADRAFRGAFPRIELLRHAIAHAAEETPKLLKQGHSSGVVVISSVVGNRFETTKDKIRIGYEISMKKRRNYK